MVPKEPTETMLDAGEAAFVSGHTGTPVSSPDDVYRAMLAAAQIERGEHETPERDASYGGPLGLPDGVRTEPLASRSGTASRPQPRKATGDAAVEVARAAYGAELEMWNAQHHRGAWAAVRLAGGPIREPTDADDWQPFASQAEAEDYIDRRAWRVALHP